MRCALSLVSYSLNQNLVIQNIPQLNVDFDVSSAVPCIIDNDVSEEIEIENATSSKTCEAKVIYTANITDAGKILLSGGKSLETEHLKIFKKVSHKYFMNFVQSDSILFIFLYIDFY